MEIVEKWISTKIMSSYINNELVRKAEKMREKISKVESRNGQYFHRGCKINWKHSELWGQIEPEVDLKATENSGEPILTR